MSRLTNDIDAINQVLSQQRDADQRPACSPWSASWSIMFALNVLAGPGHPAGPAADGLG